jgi:hypothetical protein
LRDRLPAVPVPLAGDDPDALLDLQAAFTTTYDRAGYDYALNYRRAVEPPLEASLADWVRSEVVNLSEKQENLFVRLGFNLVYGRVGRGCWRTGDGSSGVV